jgi:hypothetical protein
MGKLAVWSRKVVALAGVLALGYWLGAAHTVRASSNGSGGDGVQFQLTGVNEASSLLVYEPESKALYVYRAATTGNAALQCSFKFQMDRPGRVIQRIPCPVQSVFP